MPLSLLALVSLALYERDPHIVQLTTSNFQSVTERGTFAVEFFAPWCGHCQRFAPIWSATAASACAAAQALLLAGLDCVANDATCRKMQITSFPTIRLFVPGRTPALGQNLNKCKNGCGSPREMIQAILGALPPQPTPDLQVLIGQGAERVLNHSRACAAQCRTSQCRTSFASAQQQQQQQQQQQLGYSRVLRRGEAPSELALRPLPIDDAAGAALYSFRHELYTVAAPLGSARHEAMESWLTLLATALPGASRRAALARLAHDARAVTTPLAWQALQQPPLAMALLPQPAWAPWLSGHTPRWLACRGWSTESRGYPCGLWTLFHTLLAHSDDPTAALHAIVGYVHHFFGCQACRVHFGQLVASTSDPPPDGVHAPGAGPGGAQLWLWRAHNAVNSRLNQSSASDVLTLGLLKMDWPDSGACSGCRDGAGRWRKNAVLRYLRATYCRDSLSPCAPLPAGKGADRGSGMGGGRVGGRGMATNVETSETLRGTWMLNTVGYALVLAAVLFLVVSRARYQRRRLPEPVNVVCTYSQLRPARED